MTPMTLSRPSRTLCTTLFVWSLTACCAHAADWKWIVSTDTQRWVERPPVTAATAAVPQVDEPTAAQTAGQFPPPELAPQPPLTVVIDPAAVAQSIDGWGGCFNELGWRALLRLDPIDRQSVLRALFDDKTGLGLNIGRLPIGASDFALSAFSYDDTPGDLELKHSRSSVIGSCLFRTSKPH